MDYTACIKGVDKADWRYAKAEAAKSNKTMGDFFGELVRAHKDTRRDNWDEVLSAKPLFTKEEAEEIRKATEDFRKSFKFRY